MRRTLVVPACALWITASCVGSVAPDASLAPDAGRSDDTGADTNEAAVGVLVGSDPALLDQGFVYSAAPLGSTEPVAAPALLEGYLWSGLVDCDAERMDDTPLEFVQLFVTLHGLRADGATEFPPNVGSYPVTLNEGPTNRPVNPGTAALSLALRPSGVARGSSGAVTVEDVNSTQVTLLLDATLEDGSTVRGRVVLGVDCP